MGKRRTRYSSSLAADWVVSPPGTEKVATVEISANRHPAHEISSYEPASSYQDLDTTQGPSAVDDARKRARYKKSLPSDWIASSSEDGPAMESPHLQPLRSTPSSTPPDFKLYHAGWPVLSQPQSMNRSNTPARIIHTSLPPQKDGELVPPPAPVEDKNMFIPYRRSVREQRG